MEQIIIYETAAMIGIFILGWCIGKNHDERNKVTTAALPDEEPPTAPQPVPIEDDDKLTAYVTECARCGKDHSRMTFMPLRRAAGLYTHWTICPTCGEPILMYGVNDFC